MITLAAGGGDYLFLVVMLVFGLINWLANKAKEGKAPPPVARPVRRAAPAPAQPSEDAEAERMRRFLEALGVPSETEPSPPRPPPVPVFVPPVQPRQAPAPPPPLPARVHARKDPEALEGAAAEFSLPPLHGSVIPEFETVSSRVAADPDGEFNTVSGSVSAGAGMVRVADVPRAVRESGVAVKGIHAALRSRADLRTALILREVLGPPRSLRK